MRKARCMRPLACFALLTVSLTQAAAAPQFTAFGYTWEPRNGVFGGFRQDASGVTVINGGQRIQIEPTATSGAGIKLMQSLGFGVYEVSLTGRLDAINPNAFVGVWLYDDRANKPQNFELDYEFSQWGNQ